MLQMLVILGRTTTFVKAAISYHDRCSLSVVGAPPQHNLPMNRSDIRALKRQVLGEDSPEGIVAARSASIALLERSIRFGHKKLELRRLSGAVALGANVTAEHFQYCREVVRSGTAARPSNQRGLDETHHP